MHQFGIPADMDPIIELAHRYGLKVIEDCAHAPGAALAGRNCGAHGLAGVFSFYSNKNMTTGEGGMITTDDDALAERLRLLRSQGMTTGTVDRHRGNAHGYDIVELGFNYRLDEMRAAMDDANADPEVGVVVITGAGDKAFCAGGDVRWLQEVQREGKQVPMDPHAGIEDFLKPVIARVNGYSIGGGNHLAYFCDFTIASERAVFSQVGPRVGSPASGHWVSYLVHVVGAKKAKEVWMLCRRYTADEAERMGLVNTVVPLERLADEVDSWCEEMLRLSPGCLEILKATFDQGMDGFAEMGVISGTLYPDWFDSPEGKEGAAAFTEKRPPRFWELRAREAQQRREFLQESESEGQ